MDYASVCCRYYIQICSITALMMDLEREEHDKKELYGGGGGGGVIIRDGILSVADYNSTQVGVVVVVVVVVVV